MFGKDNVEPPKKHDRTETIIGPSVKVKGNFSGEGDVRVEGIVEGTFTTKNNLKVGKGACIKAAAKARNIFVAGKVEGNIKALEKTELTSTARISGDIETKQLCVENGAIFNGKCIMGEGAKKEEMKHEEEKEKIVFPVK